jgi:CBS domain-containing protein
MTKVKEILQEKGSTVYSVSPETSVLEALHLMAERNIGVVLVVEEGRIAGIFSERDVVADLAADECWSLSAPIRTYMTSPVYFVTPEQTLEDCMVVMNAKNIRHIPVLDGEELAGMISIRDVIEALIGDRDERIETLEHLLWVNLV